MLTKTSAIVLRATKYGDQKLIVDFYTEALGRLTCAVKIATTQRGRMKKQLFQPMNVVGIDVDFKHSRPMQKLCDIQLQRPWTTIQTDPVKMSIVMFLSEMLWYATRQEQGDKRLYDFIAASMEWLDLTESPVANFHLCFLILLSGYLGFMPLVDTYEPASYFDLRQGIFSLIRPLHSDIIEPHEASVLPQLMRMRYSTMKLYRMSRTERQRCLHLVISYYRLHLPSLPELKSLEILHDLFD